MTTTSIAIIAAIARNGVIGREGQLPWRLSADLKHFKSLTIHKPIMMGRKTYESVGRPLPDRKNIIVTRKSDYLALGCFVVSSFREALALVSPDEECMVIGGAQLYEEALPYAKRFYLTEVHADVEGDVFFPEWNREEWQEMERYEGVADEKNEYPYSFVVLQRCERPV